MATKKQKRELGYQRHLEDAAKLKASGLTAQKRDREHRQQKLRDEWRDIHKKKHSFKNRIKECPLCQDLLSKSNGTVKKEKG